MSSARIVQPRYIVDADGNIYDSTNPLPVGIYGADGNIAYVDPYSGAVGVMEKENLQYLEGSLLI